MERDDGETSARREAPGDLLEPFGDKAEAARRRIGRAGRTAEAEQRATPLVDAELVEPSPVFGKAAARRLKAAAHLRKIFPGKSRRLGILIESDDARARREQRR